MLAATVVTRPTLRPSAARIAPISDDVVVLPSVPVTPTTGKPRDGKPCHAADMSAHAARPLGTVTRTTDAGTSTYRSATMATAPRATASGTNRCESSATPG